MVLLGSSEEKDSPCAVLQLEADIILLDHNASSHTPIKVRAPFVTNLFPHFC
jgi:hypothetical protein